MARIPMPNPACASAPNGVVATWAARAMIGTESPATGREGMIGETGSAITPLAPWRR